MKRCSPAFSLIEVMVALAISSLMVGLVAAGFAASFRAHQRAMDHLELEQTKAQAMERIRRLLQVTYLSPYVQNSVFTPFETFDDDSMSKPYDAITFTTLGHTSYKIDAKESELAEITVFTEKEPEMELGNERLQLHRLRVRVGGEINQRFEVEGGVVYTLADHVTKFLLEYLNRQGEWKSEWIPTDHGWSLPCAIRVTLGLRTHSIEEIESTIVVPIEMTKKCIFEDETEFEEWIY